jgi:hypothetical protein
MRHSERAGTKDPFVRVSAPSHAISRASPDRPYLTACIIATTRHWTTAYKFARNSKSPLDQPPLDILSPEQLTTSTRGQGMGRHGGAGGRADPLVCREAEIGSKQGVRLCLRTFEAEDRGLAEEQRNLRIAHTFVWMLGIDLATVR